MADKHEIEDNTPRDPSRQEVEFLPKSLYERASINLMKQIKKQIRKQIQHAEITDLSPLQANSDET